jgi:hypothetical protein
MAQQPAHKRHRLRVDQVAARLPGNEVGNGDGSEQVCP